MQYCQLKDDKYYINNHLSFKVLYHEDQTSPDARIVGFHVIPSRYAIFHDQLLSSVSKILFSYCLHLVSHFHLPMKYGVIYIYNSFVLICYSIKHEYGAWDDNNPKVQTCNANIKVRPGSHTPQEVAHDAYVVFSYDSTFKV
jgi:transmembrane 9 superfamily member 2/4